MGLEYLDIILLKFWIIHNMVYFVQQAHWGDNCRQGPVVTFNLKRFDGTWIGYREVEKLSSLNGIHLRVSLI
jgi:molybdenum cofactor sulfurtransferase